MPPPTPNLLFLGTWDILIIVAYVLALLFVGFRASFRRGRTTDDYLIAGRSLTLPVFVATLVSTWYGGILGVGEFSYRYGISTWVVFGVPYYLFALLYAFLLAPKIRRSGVISLPDKLEESYGRSVAVTGGVLTFLLVNPAPYVLMVGLLAQMFFGWTLLTGLIAGSLVSVIFLFVGGLRAGVATNVVQFGLMYAGFIAILATAISEESGMSFLSGHLPALHLTPLGEHSAQYIVVWFLIALWTIVDPSFHQRCAAAASERTARNGILVSVGFWFLFDALTVTTGLYARAYLPNLEQPALAYPELANLILPEGLLGMFYVGLLATVMSTLTSMMHLTGVSAGRDIAARLKGRVHDPLINRWVRWGLFAGTTLSILLAWALPSVVELWYTVGTCIIPGLLMPVLSAYDTRLRINSAWALRVMIAGPFLSTSWLLLGVLRGTEAGAAYPFGVEPIIPGLALAIVLWFVPLWKNIRWQSGRA